MAATILLLLGAVLVMTSRLAMGQLPGHGAWGGGYGSGWGMSHGAPMATAAKPRMLTCAVQRLPDGPRLSVTMRESRSGGLYDHRPAAGLALSPVFSAFSSLGEAWGFPQSGGLDIDISVFLLRDVPTAYFALTEFSSSTQDTCSAQSFGKILSPSSHGYAGGAHIANMSPLYGGFVPAQASNSYRQQSTSIPGVVTSSSVKASTSQSFRITQLKSFKLEDLAGRGFIVCDSISYDWDWQPVCDSQVIDICCGLTFSNQGASVSSVRASETSVQIVY